MDIEALYTAARDGGINFEDDQAVYDCEQIWLEACLKNEEFMTDWLGDFLMELTTPKNIRAMSDWLSRVVKDRTFIASDSCASDSLIDVWSGALVLHQQNIGSLVSITVERECREQVKNHLHDWFADCAGYHRDMQAGIYEAQQERAVEMRGEE